MQLFIDTTQKGMIYFTLSESKKVIAKKSINTDQLSENLLAELTKFLQKHQVKLSDISKIAVNPGPGPFSAVRTGVAVANALAYALGIRQKQILPKYDRMPNITQPRRMSFRT